MPFSQFILAVVVAIFVTGCGRSPAPSLKGQTNATLTFFGLVIDQDGNPLPDARIEYEVEAYPKDWTFETRGRPYDTSTVISISDARGRFQFTITGCALRRLSAIRGGYRHLFEEDAHTGAPSTYGYRLIAWSDLWFKSDQDNPAVYVFVRDGVHDVSALPSKGGHSSVNGTRWTRNNPAWPKKPSLHDVVRKESTTNPG